MPYKTYHFKSLTSTQDKAKEFSKKGLSNIVVIADVQTKGRGRFKRKWHSSKGGLWMSILLKPKSAENMQYLTFIAAISVAKVIKKMTGIDAKIKWPNDVHYKGKKLCGILTEGIFGKESYAVVGIGLNVNQDKFPTDIQNTAASLKIIKKKNINITKLAKYIIDEFFKAYNKNNTKNILKTWKKYCDTMGKEVSAITRNKTIKGKAIGVDGDCSLLPKLKNGRIAKIVEGDVNVRY